MKLMFISDIHGIKNNLSKIKNTFEKFKCEKLIVLGDLYYTELRNQKKKEYDVSFVKEFLSSFKDKLICIQGNCDSEEDVLSSPFPITKEISIISKDNLEIYITHGHIYNEKNWNKENTILIFGHYHKPFIKIQGSNIFINPGSISLPKDNHFPSYLLLDENEFIIYDILDNILEKIEIKKENRL